MIKVIDDFINPAYYKVIETTISALDFGWNFNPSITGEDTTKNKLENLNLFGFSHGIFDAGTPSSRVYQFLLPMFIQTKEELCTGIFRATDAGILLRARGDMTVISKEQVTYEPHIDMPGHKEHINVVFYIGDSDGDTIIYKEKFFSQEPLTESDPRSWSVSNRALEIPKTLTEEQRISPKANRVVIFNGEHWHTGQSPKNHSRRVILNLNFAKDDYRMTLND